MFKKMFALFMSVIMLCSMCSFSVFAAQGEEEIALAAYVADTSTSGVAAEPEKIPSTRDAVVVIDTSSSMRGTYDSNGVDRHETAQNFAKAYAEFMLRNSSSRVALMSFDNTAQMVVDFTNDLQSFNDAVDNLTFSGGTSMDLAVTAPAEYIKKFAINKNIEIYIITDAQYFWSENSINYVDMSAVERFKNWTDVIDYDTIMSAEWVYNFVKNKNEVPSEWHIRTQGVYNGLSKGSSSYKFAEEFLAAIANPPGNSSITDEDEAPDFEDGPDFDFEPNTDSEEATETTTQSRGKSSYKADVRVSGEPENGKVYELEDVYVYGALKDFPLIETYEINNKDTAVAAVEDMLSRINKSDKVAFTDEEVKNEFANFAEAAISLSASKSIRGTGIITNDIISELSSKVTETKTAVDKLLSDNNVELSRDLLVGATIEAEDTIKIDADVKSLPIDNLYVNIGEDNLGITIGKQFVEELDGNEPLVLAFESIGEDENEESAEAQGEEVTGEENADVDKEEVAASRASAGKFSVSRTISTPIILSLSVLPNATPTYQGVKGPDGLAVSMTNASKRNISFRATKSGTYTVTNVTKLNFTDINNLSTVQKDTLRRLYAHGLIEGKSATSFAPETTLTRAEFTTLLIKTIGAYDPSYKEKSGFVDMNNHWAEPVIAKAKKLDIVAGYDSDNTFRPDNKLNNEQLYHMLGLTYAKNNKRSVAAGDRANEIVGKFSDNANISQWAKKNIAVTVASNIYTSNQSGKFNPKNEVSRLNAAIAVGKLFEISPFDGNWK